MTSVVVESVSTVQPFVLVFKFVPPEAWAPSDQFDSAPTV